MLHQLSSHFLITNSLPFSNFARGSEKLEGFLNKNFSSMVMIEFDGFN